MNPLEKLESLGFSNAAVVGLQPDRITVRVRTTKGWVYEKFDADDEPALVAWAAKHAPE